MTSGLRHFKREFETRVARCAFESTTFFARHAHETPAKCATGQRKTIEARVASRATHMFDPTLQEVAKQAADTAQGLGQLTISANLVWTCVCAFLVMFMQAGFALVETGLTRSKNVAHTMAMNFLVYAIGIIGFWAVGFGLQMGGVGALGTFGGETTLSQELLLQVGGKPWGLFGTTGFFLPLALYTPGVAATFLFQMVFMDTTATIPTGALAERWKFSTFVAFSLVIS